jgi:transglutaminase-like putative cysteine protease
MMYQLSHTTTYDYRDPVSLSHHVLRLRPREVRGQNCLNFQLSIDPAPASNDSHSDYFGNSVAFVAIQQPHNQLVIRSRSQVRKFHIPLPDPAETPSWEHVRDLSRGCQIGPALEASEFLFDSPLIKAADQFGHYASASFAKGRSILEAVLDFTRRIHTEFTFDPKSTTIATPVEEVFKSRRGVCQDFAQVQIACMRSLGLPARYVSGYLETVPAPGKEKLIGADASHAWVSFYCHGLGWIDVDPTNNVAVGEKHVTVGWGRDYSDVSPVRGVILGSGEHTVKVAVDVQRLEITESVSGPEGLSE